MASNLLPALNPRLDVTHQVADGPGSELDMRRKVTLGVELADAPSGKPHHLCRLFRSQHAVLFRFHSQFLRVTFPRVAVYETKYTPFMVCVKRAEN